MSTAHRVYVGTIGEGVWRSGDGGETFSRASDGMFVECHVRALVSDPRDPDVLFAGTEQGLFRTDNGADSWRRVDSPLNGLQLWSILLHPADPEVILVGACPSRLLRSGDGGVSWAECTATIEQHCPRIVYTRATCFLADPDDPLTLWCGVEIDGVRRSRDGGRSWERVGEGLSSQDIHALALVPAGKGRPRRMLAATNNDLNASEDGGEGWRPLDVKKTLPWSYCRAIALPYRQPEVVLLGNGNGPPGSAGVVARSDDGGMTWRAVDMPGLANSTIWNFGTHPADPLLIYASSVSGEVYRSRDGGLGWVKLVREFGEIRALAWTP